MFFSDNKLYNIEIVCQKKNDLIILYYDTKKKKDVGSKTRRAPREQPRRRGAPYMAAEYKILKIAVSKTTLKTIK